MKRYIKGIDDIKHNDKLYEVWGFNKKGNVQYFGGYSIEDFKNSSSEFKAAYYEYTKYFFDTEHKYVNGPNGDYLKAAKKLSKLEKKEGIKRYESIADIAKESKYSVDELLDMWCY